MLIKINKKIIVISQCIAAVIMGCIFCFFSAAAANERTVVYAHFQDAVLNYKNYMDIDGAQVEIDRNNRLLKLAPLFKGALVGYERYFYEECEKIGLPFDMALAITLHESAYGTSNLAMTQNNFGGIRSGDGWASFATVEEGIDFYLNLLKTSYFDKGADTPETIGPIYAPGSQVWAIQIRQYMEDINELLNS